ncbi:hypothetical protein M514_07310 [Trichuris suis]|uniref:non-specific serine/threonine protein kinase n=1 Tax=Trichuris suis TaxID=68888 RepID=A0A085N3Z3_9BILA|nr:hypothetical protein M514_07310 [Trichuris suis]
MVSMSEDDVREYQWLIIHSLFFINCPKLRAAVRRSTSTSGEIKVNSDGIVLEDVIVGRRNRLIRRIGSGSFGDVFEAIDMQSRRVSIETSARPMVSRLLLFFQNVAIKIDCSASSNGITELQHEHNVYLALKKGFWIPRTIWFGVFRGRFALAMELLDTNLEELRKSSCGRFPLPTTIHLAQQMLSALEFVHNRGFVHRDVKPENFLMGLGRRRSHVYLTDFGLAKRWCDPLTKRPYEQEKREPFAGTVRYTSINAHLGQTPARGDDLESLGYILLAFHLGTLPWWYTKGHTRKQCRRKVCELKLKLPLEKLCQGCPKEFRHFIEYVRQLGYDCPDYDYLRFLFNRALPEQRNDNSKNEIHPRMRNIACNKLCATTDGSTFDNALALKEQ